MYASVSLISQIIKEHWKIFDLTQVENIFRTIHRRYTCGIQAIPFNILQLMIKCQSMLAIYFPEYFDLYPELPIPHRILFFLNIYEEISGEIPFYGRKIAEKFKNSGYAIARTLQEAKKEDINSFWLRLLNAGIIICGFSPELSDYSFFQFTEQVQYVVQLDNIFSETLSLLETFSLLDPPSSLTIYPSLSSMYYIVINACIKIANNFLSDIISKLPNPTEYGPTPFHGCISIMGKPEFSHLTEIISKFETPAYIFSKILDFSLEYWENHLQDAIKMFGSAFQCLQYLAFHPSEFLDFSILFAQILSSLLEVSSNFSKISADFTKILMDAANAGGPYISPILMRCFSIMTSTNNEEVNLVIHESLTHISPGVYYAIGSTLSTSSLQKCSLSLFRHLFSLKDNFPLEYVHAACFFIRHTLNEFSNSVLDCIRFLCELFHSAISRHAFNECLDISKSIYTIAGSFYTAFITNSSEFMPQLIEWSTTIPFPATVNLNRLFIKLTYLFFKDPKSAGTVDVSDFRNALLTSLSNSIEISLQREKNPDYLGPIISVFQAIMKESYQSFHDFSQTTFFSNSYQLTDNSNSFIPSLNFAFNFNFNNTTPTHLLQENSKIHEYEEVMNQFWSEKFIQIWDAWYNLWNLQNDDVQINLCKFLETAIICKWDNRERILGWLVYILPVNPVPEHIILLERYLESPQPLEPVEGIIEYLKSLPGMNDPEIAYEVLRFIQIVFLKKIPPYFEIFNFHIVCSVLSANYNNLVEEALDTLEIMVQCTNIQMICDDINIPITSIATNMLNRFNQNQAIKAVKVLLLIQNIHYRDMPSKITGLFQDMTKKLAETEMFKRAFQEKSRVDSINGTYGLVGVTMNMILAYRESQETTHPEN